MSEREQARILIMQKAILDELSTADEETRGGMREVMLPGDKIAVPGLGYVQMTTPRPSLQVVDWTAFTKWVEDNAPEAFITQVVMSKHWLAELLKAGEYVAEGGVVLVPDGLGVVEGTPQLRVVPSDEAHDRARALLGAQLQIEAGPEAEQ